VKRPLLVAICSQPIKLQLSPKPHQRTKTTTLHAYTYSINQLASKVVRITMNAPYFGTGGQPEPGYASAGGSGSFQSIEDFMREQTAKDPQKAAELKAIADARLANSRPTKKLKSKAPVDERAVALEARALAEMGDTNWTGRLGGK
jgi:hypothetical protein